MADPVGSDEGAGPPFQGTALPMVNPVSLGAGNVPARPPEGPPVAPQTVERGVVVFDLDGTLLDDIELIAHVASDVLHKSFGTPPAEARIHYLATTGMPFEAQLAQLYPDAPADLLVRTARSFHERKATEAYTYATRFPEVPRLLKRLAADRWTLVISTGAEREVADLLLEREGLRIWFEGILGSGQGTKREHLHEYRRRYPGVPIYLVGDSRFDLEAARDAGVPMLARAAELPGWTLSPEDFRTWGAVWAAHSLAELPEVLEGLGQVAAAPARSSKRVGRPKSRGATQRPRTRK